jgi:hypothetical protein
MRYSNFINEKRSEHTIEDILYNLYYKCEPFLKELLKKGNYDLLYSGRDSQKDYFEKKVRKNRYPSDTPDELHQELDKEFKKKFGVPARSNSIFCTGDFKTASSYGINPYSIYAIGKKYKYIWSPYIKDLYSDWFDSGDDEYIIDIEDYIDNILTYDNDDFMDIATEYARNDYDELLSTLDPDEDELPDEDEWIDDNIDTYIEYAKQDYKIKIEQNNENSLFHLIDNYQDTDLVSAIQSKNEIMLVTDEIIAVHYKYSNLIKYYFQKNGIKKPTLQRLQNTFTDNIHYNIKIYNN